jgi:SAM-dependent methyltransferase
MERRKKPLKLFFRVVKLLFADPRRSAGLVTTSYDRIGAGYNDAWTHHMRDLTGELIDRMDLRPGQKAMDLTCGTGYATGLIAQRTGGPVVGVDASEGMLAQARAAYPETCTFVRSDILDYLKTLPDESLDAVTCCWGLGYSRPLRVLEQIRRILKKGGAVGIIDNTLFSLREVLWASALTFMEQPETLENVMAFRFLMGPRHLALWYRAAGLTPVRGWNGKKRYTAADGTEAIERLRATGAAAGFEYAAGENESPEIFARFAEILDHRCAGSGGIPIIHRYLAGIASK